MDNGSYRNTEVRRRYGISRSCGKWTSNQ